MGAGTRPLRPLAKTRGSMSAAAVLKLKERQGATQRQSLLELRHDEQAFIAQVLSPPLSTLRARCA
jgi:predicted methyltransferase MtxX (methanogen marker protein 4)